MKRGLTLVELLLAITLIALLALFSVPFILNARPAAKRAKCAKNLKQFGVAFKIYAMENSEEKFPPCRPFVVDASDPAEPCTKPVENYGFVFYPPALFPEYLTDPTMVACPADSDGLRDIKKGSFNYAGKRDGTLNPCRIDSPSYVYLGWVVKSEDILLPGIDENIENPGLNTDFNPETVDKLKALFEPEDDIEAQFAKFDSDIFLEGKRFYRLREGVQRFLITVICCPSGSDIWQAEIPIMFDTCSTELADYSHATPPGCNVLYMDGHVEFSRYPGGFATSKTFAYLNEYLGDS